MHGKKLSQLEISKFIEVFGEGELTIKPESKMEQVFTYTLDGFGFHKIDGKAIINPGSGAYYFHGEHSHTAEEHADKIRNAYNELKKDKIKLLKIIQKSYIKDRSSKDLLL